MTSTIYRVVGDHGYLARIRIVQLQDAEGQPVETGVVRIRAGGLFDLPMAHVEDGTWQVDPQPGDIDRPGQFPLEVTVEGSQVTVPGRQPWTLIVRDRVEEPA